MNIRNWLITAGDLTHRQEDFVLLAHINIGMNIDWLEHIKHILNIFWTYYYWNTAYCTGISIYCSILTCNVLTLSSPSEINPHLKTVKCRTKKAKNVQHIKNNILIIRLQYVKCIIKMIVVNQLQHLCSSHFGKNFKWYPNN